MAIAFAKSVHKQTAKNPNFIIYHPHDQKMFLNKVIIPPPRQFSISFPKMGKKNPTKEEGISESIFFS